jgi:hypothetical protein
MEERDGWKETKIVLMRSGKIREIWGSQGVGGLYGRIIKWWPGLIKRYKRERVVPNIGQEPIGTNLFCWLIRCDYLVSSGNS